MEFPWTAIGVIIASVTLTVLLSSNIPKFVKYMSTPKIELCLFTYPEKLCSQIGTTQQPDGQTYDKEITVLPNVCPQLAVLIKPKWKYKVEMVEVCGHSKSTIERINHFVKNDKWVDKGYPDIDGNYKVATDIVIKKGDIRDPLILEFEIHPKFEKKEERKITVRVSVSESRKLLTKTFSVKASA